MEEYHINFHNLDFSVKEAIKETLLADHQHEADNLYEYVSLINGELNGEVA